ncbi:hypothetical protein NDU88_000649 [Pleurodeles waltl]|uniref:Uncharacterized protein n=1 Tax=Pleurodeles waltl TaxID=8319 RepID=A0AAV7R8F3_PLEWA|nr:hypothetical protein NDU88_000649 [Pleurodeles waltl]
MEAQGGEASQWRPKEERPRSGGPWRRGLAVEAQGGEASQWRPKEERPRSGGPRRRGPDEGTSVISRRRWEEATLRGMWSGDKPHYRRTARKAGSRGEQGQRKQQTRECADSKLCVESKEVKPKSPDEFPPHENSW